MRVHGLAHSNIITLSSLAGRAAPSAGEGAGALALVSATFGFSASDVIVRDVWLRVDAVAT